MELEKIIEIVKLLEGKKKKPNHLESYLIGKFVIVRTYSAGVHAGVLVAKKGKELRLKNAYRIWSWTQPETNTGSLNAVAFYGPGAGSKIGNKVSTIELTEAIEVIECTEAAKNKIEAGKWN